MKTTTKKSQKARSPSLQSLTRKAGDAFNESSGASKVALVAVGLTLVGTAPYWVPPVWRSKTVRGLATFGADRLLNAWLK